MTGLATLAALAFVAPRDALLAASPESFVVVLVIFILSAISNWLKRRAEAKAAGTTPPPQPQQPNRGHSAPTPPVAPATRWEEELRRLLEGESGAPPPLPLPVPPPIVAPARTAPPPLPPPIPARARARQAPAPEPMSEESDAPSRPLADFREADAAYQYGADINRQGAARMREAEALSSAKSAYNHGATLHAQVAARMRQIVEKTRNAAPETFEPKHARARSPITLTALRSPVTTRQAIVYAALLGPPKSLEN